MTFILFKPVNSKKKKNNNKEKKCNVAKKKKISKFHLYLYILSELSGVYLKLKAKLKAKLGMMNCGEEKRP